MVISVYLVYFVSYLNSLFILDISFDLILFDGRRGSVVSSVNELSKDWQSYIAVDDSYFIIILLFSY